MYKAFEKYELIVMSAAVVAATIYGACAELQKISAPLWAVCVFFMLLFAALFLVRPVRFAIMLLRHKFVKTSAVVSEAGREEVYTAGGSGSYKKYEAVYTVGGKTLRAELHNVFSVRRWRNGQQITVKVAEDDYRLIIVVPSDYVMCGIYSFVGLSAEIVFAALLLSACF